MSKQPDFLEEETLLQHYARELGVEPDNSPKCHPEIAGDGIEYDWVYAKLHYRAQLLSKKKSKDNFQALVSPVITSNVKYNHTFIEKCVNLFRKRRSNHNVMNFDTNNLN